jgi:2'-5' RNA ligase
MKISLDACDVEDIRFVQPENLHITLYFVGNADPDDVPELIERSGNTITSIEQFWLRSEGYKYRGKPDRASMIWLAFMKNDTFTKAHEMIRDVASDFVDPQTNFREPVPHITVARMGRRYYNGRYELPGSGKDIEVLVDKIGLWRSEKKADGIRYSCLAEWPLASLSGGLSDSP